jgi:hypothetical protein
MSDEKQLNRRAAERTRTIIEPQRRGEKPEKNIEPPSTPRPPRKAIR